MEADYAADLTALETTPDHATRDRLALRLADANAPGTPEVLLRLIAREDLANHRGTLVYSLGHFDCSGYVPMLARLVATANFEVAHAAFCILSNIKHVAEPDIGSSYAAARSAASVLPDDWRRELLEELVSGSE